MAYSPELEELIEAILLDGQITEKEREVLRRRAEDEDLDPDEVEIIVEARLAKLNQENEDPQASEEKSSRKRGNIRECPNCGAKVEPFRNTCEECGHEFTDIQAVNSVKELSDKLSSAPSKKHIEIIAAFPVPNTREDLLELIVYTESKFLHLPKSSETEWSLARAYKAKYSECIEKAMIYFGDDPKFAPLFKRYKKNKKKLKISPVARGFIIYILFIAAIFIGCAIGGAFD